jgi:hypothetical protein
MSLMDPGLSRADSCPDAVQNSASGILGISAPRDDLRSGIQDDVEPFGDHHLLAPTGRYDSQRIVNLGAVHAHMRR